MSTLRKKETGTQKENDFINNNEIKERKVIIFHKFIKKNISWQVLPSSLMISFVRGQVRG